MREPVNYTAKATYAETIRRVEVLRKRLHDLVKAEFDRMGWDDITPAQALMMFNMNGQEMNAGELITRGCYTGSNVSYNLRKLVEGGYLTTRPGVDRRELRVSLTGKGEEVAEVIDELLDQHIENGLAGIDAINDAFGHLDKFWYEQAGMMGRRP